MLHFTIPSCMLTLCNSNNCIHHRLDLGNLQWSKVKCVDGGGGTDPDSNAAGTCIYSASLLDALDRTVAASGSISASLYSHIRAGVLKDLHSLRLNGARANAARYPNADIERDQFPTGYVAKVRVWVFVFTLHSSTCVCVCVCVRAHARTHARARVCVCVCMCVWHYIYTPGVHIYEDNSIFSESTENEILMKRENRAWR